MKTIGRLALLGALLLAFALTASCNSSGDGATGQISIALTDAAGLDPDVKEVWITIDGISIHRETAEDDDDGHWLDPSGASFPLTVDLFALRNGITEPLGLDELEADHYTQIRLHLGETPEGGIDNPHPYPNYVVLTGDVKKELTVPSGYQSGLKLTHPFYIQEDTVYEIILDIDTMHIHETGSGKWIMKPTIKVIEVDLTATIEGEVTANEGCEDLSVEGVYVMAQVEDAYEPTGVRVVQTTVTEADGTYTLAYLAPGTYNVVAYRDDPANDQVALEVDCGVEVEAEETETVNIELECEPRVEAVATVMAVPPIPVGDPAPQVTVVGSDVCDFIATIVGTTPNGAIWEFSAGLPADTYDFIFEADGYETEEKTQDVGSNPDLGTVTLNP